ncbi:hypothetical protein DFH94DRAFT_791926 [Russula ochroleuca]|uniref:STEEP1 domain-containing protein n=1 Tax=Russula ochroleuca TaxID=152965 RepID=A0A9P5N2X4_9AGAM|nr:hypothetical protein DFH94DRAFT_791926 [Russula ochroleuca]
MPKVVSRSAVSTSADARPTASSAAALKVYYCICGEFILVIDAALSSLPRRQTDGAIIVRSQDKDGAKAKAFKLNAQPRDPILIERSQGGHERQYRFQCPRCTLPVAYQPNPPPATAGPFLYIFKGALTQIQGQLPSDAFDDEEYPNVTSDKSMRPNTIHE